MKKYLIAIGIAALGGWTAIGQTTATNAVPAPMAQKSNPLSSTNNAINEPAGAPLQTNSPSLNTNTPTPLRLNGNSLEQK